MSFTPLQLTLGSEHGDLRLVCGCSAMETHFMRLSANSYCAGVASRGSLELGSGGLQPRTDDSAHGGPVLCVCVVYHFVAEPLLLLDVSTSQ